MAGSFCGAAQGLAAGLAFQPVQEAQVALSDMRRREEQVRGCKLRCFYLFVYGFDLKLQAVLLLTVCRDSPAMETGAISDAGSRLRQGCIPR